MTKKRALGALPSPKDDRDYNIGNLITKAVKLPESFRNDITGPVFDQGQSSTCVACSLSLSRFLQESRQEGQAQKFSPTYIYGNRRPSDLQAEGMYPRQALKTLQEYGACHWDDCPGFYSYPESKNKYDQAKSELDKKAYPYRISSYYLLRNQSEVKVALIELGVVTGMFPVFDCLYNVKKDGKVSYDKQARNINYGYHQMTIIGYDQDGWIVQNSWGSDWGDSGVCYLPYDYPIEEVWAMTDEITQTKLEAETPALKRKTGIFAWLARMFGKVLDFFSF